MRTSTEHLVTAGLFFVLVVAAVAGRAAADDEPDPPRVSKLSFEGVDAVPESEVRDDILTTGPGWRFWRPDPPFDAGDLEEDLGRIAALYRDHGYYDARAESSLRWNDDRDEVAIEIRVYEGEPIRLAEWRLDVPEDAPLDAEQVAQLRDLLPAPGSVFGVKIYREVRTKVLQRMGDLGRPAATFAGGADVEPALHSAQVAWTLRVGPEVEIGEISVIGLADVDEHIVRRELRFAPGDRFSRRELRASQRRLFDTRLFHSVAIQALESDAASGEVASDEEASGGEPSAEEPKADETRETVVWPIEIRVRERPPRSFRVGVGYGTEDQFRARAGWTHRNFLGDARQLSVGGKYSSIIGGGEVSVLQPYLFDVPLRSELRLSAFRENPRAYTANRFAEELGFEHPLGSGFSVLFGQRFEWADVTDQKKEEEDDDDLPEKVRLHTLPFGLRHTTLDDPIDPTRGTWLDFAVEPAFEPLGSSVDYVKLTAEARGFVPIWQTVFATRFRIGTLKPWSDSGRDDVPVFKRFYAGGSTSVRGFGYQKLGKLDDDGDPLGGFSIGEASVELRFPIWKPLSGVVFSDAGQLSLPPFHWSTRHIYYSSGVGLRLATPVGPIRVDVARIYNPPSDIDRYGFYVSVGQAF